MKFVCSNKANFLDAKKMFIGWRMKTSEMSQEWIIRSLLKLKSDAFNVNFRNVIFLSTHRKSQIMFKFKGHAFESLLPNFDKYHFQIGLDDSLDIDTQHTFFLFNINTTRSIFSFSVSLLQKQTQTNQMTIILVLIFFLYTCSSVIGMVLNSETEIKVMNTFFFLKKKESRNSMGCHKFVDWNDDNVRRVQLNSNRVFAIKRLNQLKSSYIASVSFKSSKLIYFSNFDCECFFLYLLG